MELYFLFEIRLGSVQMTFARKTMKIRRNIK